MKISFVSRAKRFALASMTSAMLIAGSSAIKGAPNSNNGFTFVPAIIEVQAQDSVAYFKKYTGKSSSIVDIMKWYGHDSSFSARKAIAVLNGITNYTGTASQNLKLVSLAKNGKLIKSKTSQKQAGSTSGVAQSSVSYTKFTNDSRWRIGKRWTGGQKPLVGEKGYTDCAALCSDWAKFMYGKKLSSCPRFTSASQIRAGDVIKMYYKGTTKQHWMIVVAVKPNGTLTCLEGNWGKKIVLGDNYRISGNTLVRGGTAFTIATGYHCK